MQVEKQILADQLQESWELFCADQNETTFAGVYENSQRYVFTICYRILGREDEAFDAAQNVYSALLELAVTQPEIARVDINMLVRRLAAREADTMRKRTSRESARTVTTEAILETPAACESPRSEASRNQLRNLVNEEIMALPESIRVPLILHHEQGMTHQEIADALSLSRSYISKQIKEGHESLAIALRRRGVVDPVLALVTILAANELLRPSQALAQTVAQIANARLGFKTIAPQATAGLWKGLSSLCKSCLASSPVQTGVGAGAAALAVLFLLLQPGVLRDDRSADEAGRLDLESTFRSEPSVQASRGRAPAAVTPAPAGKTAADHNVSGHGPLSGRVVSRYDGKPLGGFVVNLPDFQTSTTDIGRLLASTTTTDPDGNFRFASVPEGTYRVVVQGQGVWREEATTGSVLSATSNNVGEIALNRYGSILGKLVRGPDAEPVANEKILLVSNVPGFKKATRTSADGSFRFDGLDLPHYGLWAHSGKHFHAVNISKTGVRELTWHLGNAAIRGVVTREGSAAEPLVVRAYRYVGDEHSGALARVGTDGQYRIEDLPPGMWTLEARPSRSELVEQNAEKKVVLADSSTVVHDFHLASGRAVGKVTDVNGNPVSGVAVQAIPLISSFVEKELVPKGHKATTSDDGNFVLEGYPAGTYTLVSLLDGGEVAFAEKVHIPESGDTPAVSVAPARGDVGNLQALLLSSADGKPVQNGWLELKGPPGRLLMQADSETGEIHVAGLPAGDYEIRSSSFGFTVGVDQMLITGGETKQLTQVLDKAGALEWVLSGFVPGETDPMCKLTPVDPNSLETQRTGALGPDGVWRIRGILPGQYVATVQVNGRDITEHLRIDPGAETAVITQVQTTEVVSGR